MKDYLKAAIDGRGFFRTYILFYIPILILGIITSPHEGTSTGLQLLSVVESYLSLLLQFAFFCYLITAVVFRNTGFPFSGSLGNFAGKAALWFFLTMITLGIYGPWFIRNYIDYILGNLSWNGKKADFISRPGQLLLYMFLLLFLPIIVMSLILGFSFYGSVRGGGNQGLFVVIFTVLSFLIFLPFFHAYLRWLINLKFSGYHIRYQADLSETLLFLAGQMLLSIVTLFIYYPAAGLKVYRFIAEKAGFEDEDGQTAGRLGFDGNTGEGFGLLWGQFLLTLITLGIYGPWAMARVTNWFLNRTFLEGDVEL